LGSRAARSKALRVFPSAGLRYLISPGGPYFPRVFLFARRFLFFATTAAFVGYDDEAGDRQAL
jgi:hypothetical protein